MGQLEFIMAMLALLYKNGTGGKIILQIWELSYIWQQNPNSI